MVLVSRKFKEWPVGAILVNSFDGESYEYRIVSEPYTDERGRTVIEVVSLQTNHQYTLLPALYGHF